MAYHGTSLNAPADNLVVSESQQPFNGTNPEIGQNNLDIVMDLDSESLNFGNSFDGDSDAMRSYYVAATSDIC
jgi:hypothetical protein